MHHRIAWLENHILPMGFSSRFRCAIATDTFVDYANAHQDKALDVIGCRRANIVLALAGYLASKPRRATRMHKSRDTIVVLLCLDAIQANRAVAGMRKRVCPECVPNALPPMLWLDNVKTEKCELGGVIDHRYGSNRLVFSVHGHKEPVGIRLVESFRVPQAGVPAFVRGPSEDVLKLFQCGVPTKVHRFSASRSEVAPSSLSRRSS